MPDLQPIDHIKGEGCISLTELLGMRALATPDALLYRFLEGDTDESMTYLELHQAALGVAADLTVTGRRGDRVLLLFKPGTAYISAFFGCLYAGRIAVPLYPPRANPKSERVSGALFDCGATVALTEPRDQDAVMRFLSGIGLGEICVKTVARGCERSCDFQPVAARGDQIAFLQYTSGSTGNPKGVMVSHANLLANQAAIQAAFGTTERDICFNWLPLYHDMGLIGNVLHPLYVGFPSILTSPTAFIRDPLAWLEGIDRLGATVAGAPNFAYDLLCRRLDAGRLQGLRLDRWRVAYNGAEPVRAETLTRFAETFSPFGFSPKAFYPCYGMAEATLFISGGKIGEEPLSLRVDKAALGRDEIVAGSGPVLTSCGAPFGDHQLRVVDPQSKEPLAERQVGELWFKGPSRTQGYWGQTTINAEIFDAETASGDGPWMRTGDLGFVADGNVFITGRLKDLIIIRGRNHYPQDIELTAEESGSIFKTAAAFSLSEDGDERLVLAVELERRAMRNFDRESAAATIRESVSRNHEIALDAVVFLQPGALPKTSSGKKRRFAVREGYLNQTLAFVPEEAKGQETATQVGAATVWTPEPGSPAWQVRELLARCMRRNPENLSSRQALTSQGLDSIGAIEIQQAVFHEMGLEIPIIDLLGGLSPDQLCTRIHEGRASSKPVEPQIWQTEEVNHLSFNQEPLFFHTLIAPQSTPHNLVFGARFEQPLEQPRLEAALKALMLRHPILNSVYFLEDGRPCQRWDGQAALDLAWVQGADWSEAELQTYLARAMTLPFDLEHGPIFRTRVVDGPLPTVLFCVHHIAVDFQALVVLVRDLAQLYAGRRLSLPEGDYRDFVVWQRLNYQGERLEKDWRFWRERLAGDLPVLALPRDFVPVGRPDYAGSTYGFHLSHPLCRNLKDLAKERQTTLFTVLIAGYLQFLHRLTGQDDVLVGTPVSQRHRPEFANVVGYLANMVVIRDSAGTASLSQAVTSAQRLVLEALEHGSFPFQTLVQRLNPQRDNHHPFFQTAFVLQQTSVEQDFGLFALGLAGGQTRLGDWSMESLALPTAGSQFDLTLTVAETEGGLAARIEYARSCFQPETIARFARLFEGFLTLMIEKPELNSSALALVPEQERHALLALSENECGFPLGESLVGRFERIAARFGDRHALHYGDNLVTYGELDKRANAVAAGLWARGVRGGDRVGLFCEPSPEMIIGLLGILKCSAVYVPLDPAYPQERLDFLVQDSRIHCLLTDGSHQAGLEVQNQLALPELQQAASSWQAPPVDARLAAYMIYTSGSTGRPKGTLISHYNVIRLFQATDDLFGFNEDDTWTLFHSFAFDFSVWEIWGALLHGGKLLVLDKAITRAPARCAELLVKERVTVLNQTPSAFYPLIPYLCGNADAQKLRFVIFGGEALTVKNLVAWFDRFSEAGPRLINMYGITETCVHVTWREIGRTDLEIGVSPIGKPIADLSIRVLDSQLRLTPHGMTGEMYVSGAGSALGYWGRPGLTATRFLPDPYAQEPGTRMYRSGDGARFSSKGDLLYLGRLDEQVKVRGFRIELGEIAAVLRSHDQVDQVVVVAQTVQEKKAVTPSPNAFHSDQGFVLTGRAATPLRNLLKHDTQTVEAAEDKRLVAYFIPAGTGVPSGPQLRAFLTERLPEHMIPSLFIQLQVFPLTHHGKLDYKALPQPSHGRPMMDQPFVPPRNQLEQRMAEVWAEVLQLDRVGIDDPFFDLGGDSILSIRLRARAEEEGLCFSLENLMRLKTIRALASGMEGSFDQAIEVHSVAPFQLISAQDRAKLPSLVEDAYPLARLQEGLLFHSSFNQDIPMYCDIFIYQFRARFQEALFRTALDYLCERHHILRTGFDFDGYSQPLQLVYRHAQIPLLVEDFQGLARDEQVAKLHQWLEQEKRRNYDWQQPPLMRFNAFLLNDGEFYLGMSFHDVLMDGWSESSILTQLLSIYFALLEGQRPEPALDEFAYRDFVALEQRVLADETQRSFWQDELAQIQVAPLPTRQTSQKHRDEPRMIFLDVAVGADLSRDLKALATLAGTGLKQVLLAAHCRVLNLLTGHREVLTALESNGRLEVMGGDSVLGCHLNAVPFRFASRQGSWLDFIGAVHEKETRLTPYRRFPYAEIQRLIGGEVLFDTSFNYTHFHVYRALRAFDALDILGAHAYIQTHFALRVEFNQDPFTGNLSLDLEADENKLSQAQLTMIAEIFQKVLVTMARRPEAPISSICLLPDAMAETLLVHWNDTQVKEALEYPHLAFHKQVADRRDQVAVSDERCSLTYGALKETTDRISSGLVRRGVGPEQLVALLMDRGVDYVSMVLGVFKASGAYLPLAGKPLDRASRILAQADCRLLVCYRADQEGAREILATLGNRAPALAFVEDLLAEEATLNDASLIASPQQLANVFFTSGSTGEPKGAMIHYLGMANHLRSKIHMMDIRAEDLVSQDAAQTFDISLWQMLAALMVGGRVNVFPDEISKDPIRLFHAVEQQGVTILEVSPAVLGVFVEEAERLQERRPSFARLRYLPCSGEALPPDTCRRWAALYPQIPVINMWGATECSDDVSWVKILESLPQEQTLLPLGRPIGNIQILLLDCFGQLAPLGSQGELYIGGTGVGRGYRGDSVRTALAFTPNPFAGKVIGMPLGARLYRTGDLGRMGDDGQAVFLGRTDHQVKIRGHRVELGDIEAALLRQPEISQALVITAKDLRGDHYLAAYLCPQAPLLAEDLDLGPLRRQLADLLPAYMLPSTYTVLPEFPLNNHGKIDRKALPVPVSEQEDETVSAPPQTDTERILAGIWAELLERESVGRDQDFFMLGGHSLLATRVASRIREQFSRNLSIRMLFEHTTIAELAMILDADKEREQEDLDRITPTPDQPAFPLSFAQKRLWVLDQLEGDEATYNMASSLALRGPLSSSALFYAMARIIARHETLRTRFHQEGDQVWQQVAPSINFAPWVIDLEGLDLTHKKSELNRLVRAASRLRFHLDQGPLLHIALVRSSAQEHLLLITLHHIISDGWSGGVMIRELAAFYRAFLLQEPSDMPAPALQYRDYAIWQNKWFQGARKDQQLRYWRDRLAGAPPLLDLPTDFPRPAVQSFKGSEIYCHIPTKVLAGLQGLAEIEGLSLFMLLHGALALLLSQYSGERDIVIGSPVANRDRSEIESLIGFFVNTLVLRTLLEPGRSLRENLRAVKDIDLGAFSHQHLPFEQLVDELQPERNLSHNPVFQVMLVLQNATKAPMVLSGLELEYNLTRSETSKFDMLLSVEERWDGLEIAWEYATDLFAEKTIQSMADQFLYILELLPERCDRPLGEFPALRPAHQEILLTQWNDRSEPLAMHLVHQFFEAQSLRTPHNTALVTEGEALTYKSLDRLATAVAASLQARGIGTDDFVGLAVNRNTWMAVGLLAILKAGAAYVPLDPNYPEKRLAYMLADAAIPLVLSQREVAIELPPGTPVLCLDEEAACSEKLLAKPFTPLQAAYGIYTSGSTGNPKCSVLSHGALANMVQFFASHVGSTNNRALAYASLSFDVHLMELMGAWTQGHTAYLVPEPLRRDPEGLLRFVHRHQISRVVLPVVILHAWAELFEHQPECFVYLRQIGSTGEHLTINPAVRRLFRALPDLTLSNYYGPTETHVITAHTMAADAAAWPFSGPIGTTVPNTYTYLLNDFLNPVPAGARGYLFSGGANVARGYHRRPALTAEKFVPDPYAKQAGARMYATGDLARYDGNLADAAPPLHYLGRRDHMMKLRGFRIEPGEIAALLCRRPGIRFAHVGLVKGKGSPQLVAWLQANEPFPDARDLSAYLTTFLPDYMVPHHFVFLTDLPLSPNGKVDLRHLPIPNVLQAEHGLPSAPAQTSAERWLVKQFRDLVKREDIGLDHNFFELGGHSITTTQLANRVERGLALSLPPREVFQHPTVRALVHILAQQAGGRETLESIAEVAEQIDQMSDDEVHHTLNPS